MKKPILITDALVREPLRIQDEWASDRVWTSADVFASFAGGMTAGIFVAGLIALLVQS